MSSQEFLQAPVICTLKYFENDLVVEAGADKIKWYKLRTEELGAKSTRAVASCCNSTIAVDHPFYEVTSCLGSVLMFC